VAEKAQDLLKNGISIGNAIIYTARFETQGEWVYFSNWGDYMRLYRIRTDGTEMQKLNDDKSYDIEVSGDWVYYCNSSDGEFYKVRTDGTDRQLRWPTENHAHKNTDAEPPSKLLGFIALGIILAVVVGVSWFLYRFLWTGVFGINNVLSVILSAFSVVFLMLLPSIIKRIIRSAKH
jgi:hypothetical protein